MSKSTTYLFYQETIFIIPQLSLSKEMKLVWCPETASKAFIEGIRTLGSENQNREETDVAELISTMAGGWKAQLIIDVQSKDNDKAMSLALMSAARHTNGRYVCLLDDQLEQMKTLKGVDFLVVDERRRDAGSVIMEAKPGPRGMVVVRYNMKKNGGVSGAVMGAGMRVVRSVFLPIGKGVEVIHVGVGKGPSLGRNGRSRWIKHVDQNTGEVHLFRR
ncbi:hypothetical protein LUZ60_016131 [Juncus effusus]|nr:hypothetical protein LUZ60_016131 [Juncus effusus]